MADQVRDPQGRLILALALLAALIAGAHEAAAAPRCKRHGVVLFQMKGPGWQLEILRSGHWRALYTPGGEDPVGKSGCLPARRVVALEGAVRRARFGTGKRPIGDEHARCEPKPFTVYASPWLGKSVTIGACDVGGLDPTTTTAWDCARTVIETSASDEKIAEECGVPEKKSD